MIGRGWRKRGGLSGATGDRSVEVNIEHPRGEMGRDQAWWRWGEEDGGWKPPLLVTADTGRRVVQGVRICPKGVRSCRVTRRGGNSGNVMGTEIQSVRGMEFVSRPCARNLRLGTDDPSAPLPGVFHMEASAVQLSVTQPWAEDPADRVSGSSDRRKGRSPDDEDSHAKNLVFIGGWFPSIGRLKTTCLTEMREQCPDTWAFSVK